MFMKDTRLKYTAASQINGNSGDQQHTIAFQ